MRSLYNRIAGQNLDRLAAMSDGVFAVAMTLLVLDLRAPAAESIHSERDLVWIHLGFLCGITLVPFSTALLAENIGYRTALLVYWGNILLLGLLLFLTWRYAVRAHLIREDTPPEIVAAIGKRIVSAQSLYAFGAALCLVNTYWSIAFIALVQINYVVAPAWPSRR